MRETIARFMAGRYGMDALGRVLNIAALILAVISIFTWNFLYLAAMALWGFAIYRMLSRNHYRRAEENRAYLNLRSKVMSRINGWRARWKQRGTHRFYRCPSCRCELRVPRGKGKIAINCPKCAHKFERVS